METRYEIATQVEVDRPECRITNAATAILLWTPTVKWDVEPDKSPANPKLMDNALVRLIPTLNKLIESCKTAFHEKAENTIELIKEISQRLSKFLPDGDWEKIEKNINQLLCHIETKTITPNNENQYLITKYYLTIFARAIFIRRNKIDLTKSDYQNQQVFQIETIQTAINSIKKLSTDDIQKALRELEIEKPHSQRFVVSNNTSFEHWGLEHKHSHESRITITQDQVYSELLEDQQLLNEDTTLKIQEITRQYQTLRNSVLTKTKDHYLQSFTANELQIHLQQLSCNYLNESDLEQSAKLKIAYYYACGQITQEYFDEQLKKFPEHDNEELNKHRAIVNIEFAELLDKRNKIKELQTILTEDKTSTTEKLSRFENLHTQYAKKLSAHRERNIFATIWFTFINTITFGRYGNSKTSHYIKTIANIGIFATPSRSIERQHNNPRTFIKTNN